MKLIHLSGFDPLLILELASHALVGFTPIEHASLAAFSGVLQYNAVAE